MEALPVSVGELVAGRYLLERIVGQGGMGVVFAATDRELERRVAVKLLLPERVESEETVQRFLREARAAARLRSEHVTQVYDTGRLANGLPFIVMEFLAGRDLAEQLEAEGPPPLADLARFLLEACEALAQAHAAGIVHRDLKPANFFLARAADGSDVLKVLDFGISKISTSAALTKSATIIGSPYYMSPEQLQTPADVDQRADVWALGVIAYELFTGKKPFDSDSLPSLCVAILTSEPEPLARLRPELPAALVRLVERCLIKDRARRVQNVGEIANALAPYAPEGGRSRAQRVQRILHGDPSKSDSVDQALPDKNSTASWAHTQAGVKRDPKRGRRVALGLIALGGVAAGLYFPLRDGVLEPQRSAASSSARPPRAEPEPILPESSTARGAASAAGVPPSPSPTTPLAVQSSAIPPAPAPSPSSVAVPRRDSKRPARPPALPKAESAPDPFLRRH